MSEFTKPKKRARRLLEKDIQKACVDYARSRGFWARKFSSMSQRSVPDYLFSKWYGEDREVKWAEEFKAPDKDATDAQIEEQRVMRQAGWHVYQNTGMFGYDDIAWFKARIDALDAIRLAGLDDEVPRTPICQHVWQQCDTGPVAVCKKCGMSD